MSSALIRANNSLQLGSFRFLKDGVWRCKTGYSTNRPHHAKVKSYTAKLLGRSLVPLDIHLVSILPAGCHINE